MKTIKQISDELGISKQAVHKKVQKLPEELVHKGDKGELLIEEIAFLAMKNSCQPTINRVDTVDENSKNDCGTTEKPSTNLENDIKKPSTETDLLTRFVERLERENSFLHEIISKKDEQIAKLLEQNNRLTNTIDTVSSTAKAAQALHANDVMRIEAAAHPAEEIETKANKGWSFFKKKK